MTSSKVNSINTRKTLKNIINKSYNTSKKNSNGKVLGGINNSTS